MLEPFVAYNYRMWRWLLSLLLATSVVAQTDDPARLEFTTKSLPTAALGKRYEVTPKLQGGRGPFDWTITRGKLPPGITLQKVTGTLTGIPAQTGVYKFTLNVHDLGSRAVVEQEFTLEVTGPLLLEWVDFPKLTENTISGSIKVTNSSARGEPFDLTVIIVAANEVGKAFALGYQHFKLDQYMDQVIPFSSTVPNGRYIVHVDAIAEIAATNTIYRSRLQTATPIVVNVNR